MTSSERPFVGWNCFEGGFDLMETRSPGSGKALILGAVAYDPKVVAIWNGFREFLNTNGLESDYVLYSNYERQVEGLLDGHVHVAWNSPLAWLEAEAGAARRGRTAHAICMRDTDRDLSTVVIARADSPVRTIADLRGRRVGVGASDSPQARLIPLHYISGHGLIPDDDFEVVGFEIGTGLHGDHVGGERLAAQSLATGEIDAACILDANNLAFAREGLFDSRSTRVIATTPLFDHCNFTMLDGAPSDTVSRFLELMLGMSYADPRLRPLLDMEGLKQWMPGRQDGYGLLSRAAEQFGVIRSFLDGLEA
jgi:ABC-type phosphate/phosphonate transport system substrate-binding protein